MLGHRSLQQPASLRFAGSLRYRGHKTCPAFSSTSSMPAMCTQKASIQSQGDHLLGEFCREWGSCSPSLLRTLPSAPTTGDLQEALGQDLELRYTPAFCWGALWMLNATVLEREENVFLPAAADGSSAQRTAELGWAQQHPPAPRGGGWKQQVGGFVLLQLLRFGEAGKGGLRCLKLGARSRRILSPLKMSSPKCVLASKGRARLLWLSK